MKKKKSVKVKWTTPYYGVSHAEGLPKRYRITISSFLVRGDRGVAYMLDLESLTPFSKHVKECVGSLRYVKQTANKWAREIIGLS